MFRSLEHTSLSNGDDGRIAVWPVLCRRGYSFSGYWRWVVVVASRKRKLWDSDSCVMLRGRKFCFCEERRLWTSPWSSYGVTPILIYVTCCCVALTDVLLSSAQPSINCRRCQPATKKKKTTTGKESSPEIRPFVWRSRPKYTCAHLTWPLRRPIKQEKGK